MTGLSGLTALDFTDDRLTTLLKRLSKAETWQLIEQQVDGGAVPRRGQLLRLRPSCAAGSSHPAVKFIRIDGAGRACTVPSRRDAGSVGRRQLPQLLFEGLKLLRRDAGRFCDQRPLHTCRQEAVDRADRSLLSARLQALLSARL